MARFRTVDGKGDAVEIEAARRREEADIDGIDRRPAQHRHRLVAAIGKGHQVDPCDRRRGGAAMHHPDRQILDAADAGELDRAGIAGRAR